MFLKSGLKLSKCCEDYKHKKLMNTKSKNHKVYVLIFQNVINRKHYRQQKENNTTYTSMYIYRITGVVSLETRAKLHSICIPDA